MPRHLHPGRRPSVQSVKHAMILRRRLSCTRSKMPRGQQEQSRKLSESLWFSRNDRRDLRKGFLHHCSVSWQHISKFGLFQLVGRSEACNYRCRRQAAGPLALLLAGLGLEWEKLAIKTTSAATATARFGMIQRGEPSYTAINRMAQAQQDLTRSVVLLAAGPYL